MLAEKALARFGARVWFMGLQGSVRRGRPQRAATLILCSFWTGWTRPTCRLTGNWCAACRTAKRPAALFQAGKSCWLDPRADLFQFYHDTEALYGSLSEVGALLCPRDARGALHMGAANVYHAACHSFLFEDASANLPALYKAAFFCPAGAGLCRVGRVLVRTPPRWSGICPTRTAGPCWRGAGKGIHAAGGAGALCAAGALGRGGFARFSGWAGCARCGKL